MDSLVHEKESVMDSGGIASAIFRALEHEKAINFDILPERLPGYTWNQIFVAVDTLTREGFLTLRRAERLTYEVCLSSQHQAA
jgi:hypothetical protein